MYLGIDFLISPALKPYVIDVNVGLPGGAQEYHLTHLVHFGRPSDIFNRIEEASRRVYGRPFNDYLSSSSHIRSLKPFKIWMDEEGPFPKDFHPGLRLEDKWVQYQLLHSMVPMPETRAEHPPHAFEAEGLFREKRRWVFKRRLGRGGRGFRMIEELSALSGAAAEGPPSILQEFIGSTVEGWTFSIRSVAFGGEFMCLYANLTKRSHSNHGYLAFVSEGDVLGLSERAFETRSFNQKSWEAKIWFGEACPPYLRHNLYEDVVAQTTLLVPAPVLDVIRETSIKVERFYEALDLSGLPKACFE
jgi:hypothetical protein